MQSTGSKCLQNRMYSNPARGAVRTHARMVLNFKESNQHADELRQKRSLQKHGACRQWERVCRQRSGHAFDKNKANFVMAQQKRLATRTAARPGGPRFECSNSTCSPISVADGFVHASNRRQAPNEVAVPGPRAQFVERCCKNKK